MDYVDAVTVMVESVSRARLVTIAALFITLIGCGLLISSKYIDMPRIAVGCRVCSIAVLLGMTVSWIDLSRARRVLSDSENSILSRDEVLRNAVEFRRVSDAIEGGGLAFYGLKRGVHVEFDGRSVESPRMAAELVRQGCVWLMSIVLALPFGLFQMMRGRPILKGAALLAATIIPLLVIKSRDSVLVACVVAGKYDQRIVETFLDE